MCNKLAYIRKKLYLCKPLEKYAMPVTKQKLIRHYAMDRCLRNQTRRYYIEDLLAECNKALEANSSVATDESQSTIVIVASSQESSVATDECSMASMPLFNNVIIQIIQTMF